MKYATEIGWTDRRAYEVIRATGKTGKTLIVRRLDAKLLNGAASGEPDALEFHPGGFCGHTEGVQRYEFKPNEENRLIRIRLGCSATIC